MAAASADRNLLLGILAFQMDFVERDALIAAMNAWVLRKNRPLGQILVEQGALAEDELSSAKSPNRKRPSNERSPHLSRSRRHIRIACTGS